MRFTLRGMILAVMGVAFVLAAGLTIPHQKVVTGTSQVPLLFHLVDARDGRPVAGAAFELISSRRPPVVSTIAGSDGEVATAVKATTLTTYESLLRSDTGFFYPYVLRVRVAGYQTEEGSLRNYLIDPAYSRGQTSNLPVRVRLKPL